MNLNFNFNHRCDRCGCRYGHHKGGTDDRGAADICPPTTSFGHPKTMDISRFLADDKLSDYYAKYWAGSVGHFVPRR